MVSVMQEEGTGIFCVFLGGGPRAPRPFPSCTPDSWSLTGWGLRGYPGPGTGGEGPGLVHRWPDRDTDPWPLPPPTLRAPRPPRRPLSWLMEGVRHE